MRFSKQLRRPGKRFSLSVAVLLIAMGASGTVKSSFPKVGEKAPDFSAKDFSGRTFTLSSELKENEAALLWFTNLCQGCEAKLPELEKIKNRYERKGIAIAAISVLGTDRETVEKTIRDKKLTMRFLFDPKGRVTERFSGKYYPGACPLKNIFLVGKDGKIAYTGHYPGTEEAKITNQLDKIIGGEEK